MSKKIKFNQYRHMKLEDALDMGYGLTQESLNQLPSYPIDGTKFYSRLDVGRAIYKTSGEKDRPKEGLTFSKYFTKNIKDPFETVYEPRKVQIIDSSGKIIFDLEGEFPKSWSEISTRVAASKYFFKPNDEEWEKSVEEAIGKPYEYSPIHLFSRVSKFFGEWGEKLGYFKTKDDKQNFMDELNYLQINQIGAFNSPVYFNAGINEMYGIEGASGKAFAKDPETGEIITIEEGGYLRPQCHACFIAGPEDTLESILNHAVTEGRIFSNGSGVGHNLELRAKGEPLAGGGKSSGTMSFFGAYDDLAGIIKSGGKSRRAARMTNMRPIHPDIMEFIKAKPHEDYKALLLMRAGIEPGFEGDAYTTVKYQNTNLSVLLNGHFFEQVEKDDEIELIYIKSGEVAGTLSAREILKQISFGSWRIGDPGVQYEDPIQTHHTCKNSDRINASNPCSEYIFINDTSCNLASLNLLKFTDKEGNFDYESYGKAIETFTMALDIANYAGSYPNERIAQISPEFATIGLGYANLGALLMRKGLAYDSEEGRNLAAALTAYLTGKTALTSVNLSKHRGSFVHYKFNEKPMMEVMHKQKGYLDNINWDLVEPKLKSLNYSTWNSVIKLGTEYGFRNAQFTVLAPTGTIGLMMDCDTTGVEPSTALIIDKILSGGGSFQIVNTEVPNALRNIGYNINEISDIENYIKEKNTVRGAPHLNQDHYSIFDTALGPEEGTIAFPGHVKMLGVTQPFISGAISKTNNLPENATVKDIQDGYILGHKLGIKALAVFRDYSKPVQILDFKEKKIDYKELKRGEKRELPQEREKYSVEVEINGATHHISVGEYEDGTVGEIFISAFKSGSTMNGVFSSYSVSLSDALKRGMGLEKIVEKHIGQEFEPKGMTNHPYIRFTKSPIDFALRWVGIHYLGKLELADNPDAIDASKLRGVQNGAIRVYERSKIDAWNYDQVIKDPEYGGFVPKSESVLTRLKKKNGDGEQEKNSLNKTVKKLSGIPCPKCGNAMSVIKANCYECSNCFEKVGGCG